MAIQETELPYRIEMWDDHDTRIEELIALVADTLWLGLLCRSRTLRQKSKVLADSRR